MDFLKKMTLRTKLTIMVLIPVVGLLFFGAQNLLVKHKLSENMSDILKLSRLSVHISTVLHASQKERGITAGFLGSKGKKFTLELDQHRNYETNSRANNLRRFLMDFNATDYGTAFSSALSEVLLKLNELEIIRQQVDQQLIKGQEAIDYYTKINSLFLKIIGHISKKAPNTKLSSLSSSYLYFLKGKELAGMERALLTNTFAKNGFEPGIYLKFNSLVTKQNTFFNLFKSTALPEQIALFNEKMKAPSVLKVQQMRNIAFKAGSASRLYILLGQLYQNMSLRGAYHSVKNLLIRGSHYGNMNNKPRPNMQAHYKKQFESNYYNIKTIINKIIALPESELSNNQRKDVEIIWQNIQDYHRSIDVIITLQNRGQNIKQIDYNNANGVKINDTPANNAIRQLVKSTTVGQFGISPNIWFNNITDKINLLKEVEDNISKNILEHVQTLNAKARSSFLVTLVVIILGIPTMLLLVIYLARQITIPIKNIIVTANTIANGDKSARSSVIRDDELGKLSKSFNSMAQINEDQFFIQSLTAQLLELIQKTKNTQTLSQTLISKIASSFGIGYATIYIFNKKMHHYELRGTYGYNERKHICNSFKDKEGLAGQCAFEKQSILLHNVPDDHICISSGLGESIPLMLMIMPAIYQDKVYAVLELASHKDFTKPQIDVLEAIMPSLAISLESSQL